MFSLLHFLKSLQESSDNTKANDFSQTSSTINSHVLPPPSDTTPVSQHPDLLTLKSAGRVPPHGLPLDGKESCKVKEKDGSGMEEERGHCALMTRQAYTRSST